MIPEKQNEGAEMRCNDYGSLPVTPLVFIVMVGCLIMAGCTAPPVPVAPHRVMSIRGESKIVNPGDPGYETTLQVRWLGTTCYLLQMGDCAIITDPYFSHQSMMRTIFCRLKSDPNIVKQKTANIKVVPQAVFISHAHHDHILDLPEIMRLPGWDKVTVYGSFTATNLYSGYIWNSVLFPLSRTVDDHQWHPVGKAGPVQVEYKAYPVEHAPHLLGCRIFHGHVYRARATPPKRVYDFKDGQTFVYGFRFSTGQHTQVVYFVASSSLLEDKIEERADVAILSAALWKNAKNYPSQIIAALQPRHILIGHYDDFFQVDKRQTREAPKVKLDEFLLALQAASTNGLLESIQLPAPDSLILFNSH